MNWAPQGIHASVCRLSPFLLPGLSKKASTPLYKPTKGASKEAKAPNPRAQHPKPINSQTQRFGPRLPAQQKEISEKRRAKSDIQAGSPAGIRYRYQNVCLKGSGDTVEVFRARALGLRCPALPTRQSDRFCAPGTLSNAASRKEHNDMKQTI